MFFTLSIKPDNRLPNHNKFGNYWFSYDQGWQQHDNYWVKGYNYPNLNHGNFLKLKLITDDYVLLEHDDVRGFPLWWDNNHQTLTNLVGTGLQIWNDKIVSLQNQYLVDSDFDDYLIADYNEITLDQAADLICENLLKKVYELKLDNTNTVKKMFLTGGVDTAMIYSILKYAGVDIEIIDYEYFRYDWFLNKNFKKIREHHWGYSQIHHWTEPTMLISGAYGDEFFMRGPKTVSLWAAYHNVDLITLLRSNQNNYHYNYFLKHTNLPVFDTCWQSRLKIKDTYKSTLDLNNSIINNVSNDYQHWHLGNTLNWTPLKDFELLKICLKLPLDDLTNQILDAILNKLVIKKMYPKLLPMISTYKNLNSRENLI